MSKFDAEETILNTVTGDEIPNISLTAAENASWVAALKKFRTYLTNNQNPSAKKPLGQSQTI